MGGWIVGCLPAEQSQGPSGLVTTRYWNALPKQDFDMVKAAKQIGCLGSIEAVLLY
jgi:hypothetical protein